VRGSREQQDPDSGSTQGKCAFDLKEANESAEKPLGIPLDQQSGVLGPQSPRA
jgi:hypothetical protein